MDKGQAIQAFWSGFQLTAYDETTVPTGENAPEPPYITYSVSEGAIGEPVALTASLWYRGTSWKDAERKAAQIAQAIATMHPPTMVIDGGRLWIKRGQPWAQRMEEPDDNSIRRIVLNVEAEFLTAY